MSVDNEDLKTVSKDKAGVVRIKHGDTLHTLRRPQYGQYKAIRNAFKALTPLDSRRVEIAQGLEQLTGAEQMKAMNELLDLTDELGDAKVPVFQMMFAELADQPLPEDPNTWESWLLTDDSILPEIMEHWRTVPLARGD